MSDNPRTAEVEGPGGPAARRKRWFEKLRKDPVRWGKRMENQRQRRESAAIREREREQQRAAWALLPAEHPRKARKCRTSKAAQQARRKRDHERLPDAQIANRYLHMKVGQCPKDLIDLKRQHIRLSRALGSKIQAV